MSHNIELISSSAKAIERHVALLTKILVRLPLRDVMAFKRVSKRWLSLISDPYFSQCRTTVQGTRFFSLILDPNFIDLQHRELTLFYFNKKILIPCRRRLIFCPKLPDNYSYILQSCNGLMFVRKFSDRFIYNPSTGDKKLLPSPFPWFDKSPFVEYSLAFDPLRFLGYKLICIFHGKSLKEDCHHTMVYSSESGAWNPYRSSFSAPTDMGFAYDFYFQDLVYWIGSKSKSTLHFDLKEEYVKVDLPPLPPGPQDLNVGGHVYLTSLELNSKEAYNGYGYILAPARGYMNLVGFDFEFCMPVFRLKEDDYSSSSIQHLIKDGHEYEMTLLLLIAGKVIALRLKDQTSCDVFDFGIKIKPGHNKKSSKKRKDTMIGGSGASQEHVAMKDEDAN
ncbi:F-box protein At5g07610-like [Arachis duranensis]|uniref:F-box protein At5g07610-like n=1 Tax=Arachis duranensis TaxID=130453 RepID=A0A6P4BJB8_ARADU|nr:F-box protein At5g07610-like [Arachis duranensis]